MARLAFDLSILRVLLVEDDTFSRELEKTAFQHVGVSEISVAADSCEALDLLERGLDCDLIAFDWGQAMFDAREFVETLRTAWPGVSILMLTNNDGLSSIKVARDTGVDGCLIKPFSLDKLREAVQLALIAKLTHREDVGQKQRSERASAELHDVIVSIRKAIFHQGDARADKVLSALEMQNLQAFASNLVKQLSNFVSSLSFADKTALEVIQLHEDCLYAVLSGRGELLDHETRNVIVDGLNLAADLAKP